MDEDKAINLFCHLVQAVLQHTYIKNAETVLEARDMEADPEGVQKMHATQLENVTTVRNTSALLFKEIFKRDLTYKEAEHITDLLEQGSSKMQQFFENTLVPRPE